MKKVPLTSWQWVGIMAALLAVTLLLAGWLFFIAPRANHVVIELNSGMVTELHDLVRSKPPWLQDVEVRGKYRNSQVLWEFRISPRILFEREKKRKEIAEGLYQWSKVTPPPFGEVHPYVLVFFEGGKEYTVW